MKELSGFFGSLIGFVTIAIYLLATGFMIWIYPAFSVIEYGFATMESFFIVSPWIFIFLIPAITMRSFSEEINTGTLEMIITKPITDLQIIMGKLFANFTLVVFSLIPTLVYFYSIYQLGDPVGNIDTGGVWGSYLGLLFLCIAFTAIGVFCSAITGNQIVAFILGALACYVMYDAFDQLSRLDVFWGAKDYLVQQIGMKAHYDALGRGIADTRDMVYFISVAILFVLFTKVLLESKKW